LDLTQRRPSPKPAAGFDYFVARLRLENTVNSREYHVEKRWEDKQGGREEKLRASTRRGSSERALRMRHGQRLAGKCMPPPPPAHTRVIYQNRGFSENSQEVS